MSFVEKADSASLVLVEEFTHRVLNEYTHAIGSLRITAQTMRNRASRRLLMDAVERLHSHAKAHRALAMPLDGDCNLGEYLAGVCSAIGDAFLAPADLRLKLIGCDANLPSGRCWRLALMLSELIQNAARHGVRGGAILIEVALADQQILCRVCNAGVFDETPRPGRGHRVIVELSRDLGGSVDWLFTPTAACVLVTVPLHASERRHEPGARSSR